jgi:hypothetical protein
MAPPRKLEYSFESVISLGFFNPNKKERKEWI